MKQSRFASAMLSAGVLAALMLIPGGGVATASSASNGTVTESTSSSEKFHDTIFNVDLSITRVVGKATWIGDANGAGFIDQSTYNQSLNLPPDAQEVQAAYDQARQETQRLLIGTGGHGQTVWGGGVSEPTRTTETNIVVTGTETTQALTSELTVGPGTVIIGDRDAGGTPFQVAFGSSNTNFNLHTHTNISRDVANTHTNEVVWTVTGTQHGL